MKKIEILIFLCLFLFIACERLSKDDYKIFSYDENVSLYGTNKDNQRNWNLSCEDLKCMIVYSVGTPLKILYEKEIILSSEEEKKEIVTSIIKGIRKGKNYNNALDYQPGNSLLLNNKKEYKGKTVNEEFFKILNKLLDKNYEEIIREYKR